MDFCTIISKNYLAQARVLAKSLKEHHPQSLFFVLLVDEIDGFFDPTLEPFQFIPIEALRIPNLPFFCFQYEILELNTATKPYLIEYIFKNFNTKKIVYLDPDIKVYQRMVELENLLEKTAIILTPHILQPYPSPGTPSEVTILIAGLYNLGFIALANRPITHQMLKWWQEKLYKHCVCNPEKGIFVDQKWMDLVPLFFPDCHILRDATYNVAYWNLHERKLSFSNDTLLINNQPCVFFHFSGFNPYQPQKISKHQDRFQMEDLEEGTWVFEDYTTSLFEEDYTNCSNWPYAFSQFYNGKAIPAEIRKASREGNTNLLPEENPFALDDRILPAPP